MTSHHTARAFEPSDAHAVAALFADYMRETYRSASAMSADVVLRDGQGARFRLMLAVDPADAPVGFAAWYAVYDLHHAMAGAEIPDLYVSPSHRGRGLSVRLVAAIAKCVLAAGGTFLRAQVLTDNARRLRLVRRAAVGFAGESVYVSGRALREFARLDGADTKTLLRGLPRPEMSREA